MSFHISRFWLGTLVGPFIWLTILWLLWRLLAQREAIRSWYRGLPLIQWPAMMLIVLGSKVIQSKYCEWMQYNGRFWLSPKVEGFKVSEEEERPGVAAP